jgi:hypothetical protein
LIARLDAIRKDLGVTRSDLIDAFLRRGVEEYEGRGRIKKPKPGGRVGIWTPPTEPKEQSGRAVSAADPDNSVPWREPDFRHMEPEQFPKSEKQRFAEQDMQRAICAYEGTVTKLPPGKR